MCQKCVDAVEQYFPAVKHEDVGVLLFGATCFPFGGPEDVERQLREMHDAGVSTLDGAHAYAEREMDAAMTEPGSAAEAAGACT